MNNINNNVLYLCKDLEGVNFIKLIISTKIFIVVSYIFLLH